jgi:hypothetical protein
MASVILRIPVYRVLPDHLLEPAHYPFHIGIVFIRFPFFNVVQHFLAAVNDRPDSQVRGRKAEIPHEMRADVPERFARPRIIRNDGHAFNLRVITLVLLVWAVLLRMTQNYLVSLVERVHCGFLRPSAPPSRGTAQNEKATERFTVSE